MQLPGRLRRTTLGDLFGTLHRGRATGVLELVEEAGATAGRRHRLHFTGGLLREVETALPVPRLGEILHREGFIGDGEARLLTRELFAHPNRRAGELLIDARWATPAEVGAALRHQLRARLQAVFSVREALVSFHVAWPRRRDDSVSVPLSPHEFLHGRARARDRSGPQSAAAQRAGGSNGAGVARGELARRRRALQVLGLSEAADRRAVTQAFRRLAVRLHPDRHPEATKQELAALMRGFAEVTAAYHELVA